MEKGHKSIFSKWKHFWKVIQKKEMHVGCKWLIREQIQQISVTSSVKLIAANQTYCLRILNIHRLGPDFLIVAH